MRNNEERLGANLPRQDATPVEQIAKQAVQSGLSLDFIVPTELVPLPSKGKFYPQNHPLYNKDTIEIKQMTAKEEDILTSRSLLKKGVALDKLIASLVTDKSINTDTITSEDRNAILVAARIAAYGPSYDTQVTCPSCNTKVKSTFDLYEKVYKEENEEPQDNLPVEANGTFVIELPATKWRVVCRALNGYDEKNLIRISDSKKNSAGGDSLLMEQLKGMIVSIQGVEEKELLKKAIEAMPAADSRYLRKTYSKYIKGIDLTKTFNCSSCGYETDMEVPLTADFFWFK
jgi:transcription elongation factor Elf1